MKTIPVLGDGDLTLIPLSLQHLELVRKWRNAARQYFFDNRFVEADEQLNWFHFTYQKDPFDLMWVAHLRGQPCGTGALTHIDVRKSEAEWGRLMVGEEFARGKGVAGGISRLVRDYALDKLKLDRLYGSLYTSNEITMHIDMSAGYMPYKVEGEITYVELHRKDHR